MSKIFDIQFKVVLEDESTKKIHTEGYDIYISDEEFSFTRLDSGSRVIYLFGDKLPKYQKAKGIVDLQIKEVY